MIVLFNGERQEFDVYANPQHKNILDGLTARKTYIGQQVGDFEVIGADYDWGVGKPINKVKCVRCGSVKEVSDLGAWRRGRGERRTCPCRKIKPEKPKKKEYSEYVGETINGFRLLSYEVGKGFRAECVYCGKQKFVGGKSAIAGTVECNHQISNTYDDSIIGQKYGHLTVVERVGKYFKFRCDCGAEKVLRPTDVCRGSITTCGRSDCEHHEETGVDPKRKKAQEDGLAFERRVCSVFEKAGYDVIKTPDRGDFGVDVLVDIKGEKWAIQCKKTKAPAGVKAVAEVYAGGRYYDCTRFCVASPSGFTAQAKRIASKLGVQLETKSFHISSEN